MLSTSNLPIAALLVVSTALPACNSLCRGATPVLETTGTWETCADGSLNRLAPPLSAPTQFSAGCPTDLPRGGSCLTDAECNDGAFGACNGSARTPDGTNTTYASCSCLYSCATDADCATDEACVHGDILGGRSRCATAYCRVADDCRSGACGLADYHEWGVGVLELACRTADDECVSHDDCANYQHCRPVDGGPWTCGDIIWSDLG